MEVYIPFIKDAIQLSIQPSNENEEEEEEDDTEQIQTDFMSIALSLAYNGIYFFWREKFFHVEKVGCYDYH